MAISYKEKMNTIDTFVFDVDGVLTDGTITITTDGQMYRTMNVKDGLALKAALKAGFKVCIISGGSNEGVRKRLQGLGITDIYLGAHYKMEPFDEYCDVYDVKPEKCTLYGRRYPRFRSNERSRLSYLPARRCG